MNGLQPTQLTLFHVLWLFAVVVSGAVGASLAWEHFGLAGGIVGGLVGLVVGHMVGALPDLVATRLFFRKIARSTNDELSAILGLGFWNFSQTMALLQLAARGEDVSGELPRIIGMLESDAVLTRVYGWDAVRIVYIKETKMMEGYNPRGSTEDCRSRTATLKAALEKAPAMHSSLPVAPGEPRVAPRERLGCA